MTTRTFNPCAEPTIDFVFYLSSAQRALITLRGSDGEEWDARSLYGIATDLWTAFTADTSNLDLSAHEDWSLLSLAMLKLGRDNNPSEAFRLLCRAAGVSSKR